MCARLAVVGRDGDHNCLTAWVGAAVCVDDPEPMWKAIDRDDGPLDLFAESFPQCHAAIAWQDSAVDPECLHGHRCSQNRTGGPGILGRQGNPVSSVVIVENSRVVTVS